MKKSAPTKQSSTKPALTSFGAFLFEIPIGWTRVQPDREKTAAMILLNGTTWDRADGMLKVDVGKPALATARQTAEALAGKDGRVLPEPVSLDGVEGIRVETTSTDMSRPRFAVVMYRDDKFYLVMAASARGTDVSGAFDQVLKTWRWGGKP